MDKGRDDVTFVSISVICYPETKVEMISDPWFLSAKHSQYSCDCLLVLSVSLDICGNMKGL